MMQRVGSQDDESRRRKEADRGTDEEVHIDRGHQRRVCRVLQHEAGQLVRQSDVQHRGYRRVRVHQLQRISRYHDTVH